MSQDNLSVVLASCECYYRVEHGLNEKTVAEQSLGIAAPEKISKRELRIRFNTVVTFTAG